MVYPPGTEDMDAPLAAIEAELKVGERGSRGEYWKQYYDKILIIQALRMSGDLDPEEGETQS